MRDHSRGARRAVRAWRALRARRALRALRLATALLVALGLAACAPGAPPLDLATRIRPVWSVDAALVGSPAAADGVVLSYVNSGVDRLEIVAWEVATGAELWRDSASYGSIPGYGVGPAEIITVDGAPRAVYLQDDPADDQGWQRVVVAELESGARLDDGSLLVDAVTLVTECDDDGGACLRGRTVEEWEGRDQLLRIDLAAGLLVAQRGPTLPRNSRFLGAHVYSTLDREPEGAELLGYASDGVVLWERPYAEVFAPGYSSDGGWSWLDDDSLPTIVGTGSAYDPSSGKTGVETVDLTEQMIVGLDPDSGETRWTVDGADRWCDAAEVDTSLIADIVPVCVFSRGETTIDRSDIEHPTVASRDVDARIVGLDASTGDERWSVDAGGDPSVVRDWTSSFVNRAAVRPVSIDGRTVLVDVLTGRTSAVPSHSVLACHTERDYVRAHRPGSTEPEPHLYSGGFGVYPCDADRERTGDAFSPGALDIAATEAGGGWFIVGGSDRLAGYRTAAP